MQTINAFIVGVIASITGWYDSVTETKEDGQTLVEYALIIALIAIVLVVALNNLAGGIGGVYSGIVSKFNGS